ncbi:hypothetical protein [Streptomyces sp. NPDC052721]|uniref:hypothetical protein n=1 Tax=Streptomyces sp. NPDC052721 TaxID=3154955 RepID=UPI003429DDBC
MVKVAECPPAAGACTISASTPDAGARHASDFPDSQRTLVRRFLDASLQTASQ